MKVQYNELLTLSTLSSCFTKGKLITFTSTSVTAITAQPSIDVIVLLTNKVSPTKYPCANLQVKKCEV